MGSEAAVVDSGASYPIQMKVVRHLQAVSDMDTRYEDGSLYENHPRASQLHEGMEGPIYLTDSNSLWDQLRGQTTEHADPPRFEDEGQSGG